MFLSSLCLNFSVCNVGMVSGLLLHQASTCTQPGCCCTCWDLPMRVNFLFWLDPLAAVIRMIFLLLLHPGHLSFCMQELSPPHPQSRTTQGVSHSAHRSRVRSSLSGTTQGVSSRDWLYPLRKESNPNCLWIFFPLHSVSEEPRQWLQGFIATWLWDVPLWFRFTPVTEITIDFIHTPRRKFNS